MKVGVRVAFTIHPQCNPGAGCRPSGRLCAFAALRSLWPLAEDRGRRREAEASAGRLAGLCNSPSRSRKAQPGSCQVAAGNPEGADRVAWEVGVRANRGSPVLLIGCSYEVLSQRPIDQESSISGQALQRPEPRSSASSCSRWNSRLWAWEKVVIRAKPRVMRSSLKECS